MLLPKHTPKPVLLRQRRWLKGSSRSPFCFLFVKLVLDIMILPSAIMYLVGSSSEVVHLLTMWIAARQLTPKNPHFGGDFLLLKQFLSKSQLILFKSGMQTKP